MWYESEFLDYIYGAYDRAIVNKHKGIVIFENHLFFTELTLTPEIEEWLRNKEDLEVIWR